MPLGLTELYQRLGLSKSSIQRLTFTLEQLGYIERSGTSKKFRLGPKTLSIGFSVMRNLDLEQLSSPYLQEASKEIGETVNLAILDGKEIVYVGRNASYQALNVNIRIGSRRPLHSTSMGKVMLAFMTKDQLEEILETVELTAFTSRTITRRQDLMTELEKVRVRNFAISDEEMEIGVRSLAAPIRNAAGEVVAAVNIAVPTTRISLRKLEGALAEKVIKLADKISFVLGYMKQEMDCLPYRAGNAEEVIG